MCLAKNRKTLSRVLGPPAGISSARGRNKQQPAHRHWISGGYGQGAQWALELGGFPDRQRMLACRKLPSRNILCMLHQLEKPGERKKPTTKYYRREMFWPQVASKMVGVCWGEWCRVIETGNLFYGTVCRITETVGWSHAITADTCCHIV